MLRSRMKALSTVTSKSLAETSFQYATETECMAVLREIANDARDLCNQQLAAEAVGLIMELFPPKELNNPETFLEYAVMSIVDFPADVVAKLAHPQHGIARETKFLPSIAELVQWCEREVSARKAARAGATQRLGALNYRKRLSQGPIINDEDSKRDGFEKLSFAALSQPKDAAE